MKRPTHHELQKKLTEAIAISSNPENLRFIGVDVINTDLIDLDVLVEDLALNMPMILKEIKPKDYKGTYPPQRSYKDCILGSELFAFKWKSKFFGRLMYIKFTLKNQLFWLVSLHEDRKIGEDNHEVS